MRILVISDTHLPAKNLKSLPSIIKEEAQKSDCCFHTGDFTSYSLFKQISEWTKLYGVCGNMDETEVKNNLREREILELEGITFGLTHGGGAPANIITYVNDEFAQKMADIDVFVFGHSHIAFDKEIQGKIYFNAGSPTDKVFALNCSYGILEINNKEIKRRIITIE